MSASGLLPGSSQRRDYALLEVMGTPGQEVFRARASDGRYVALRYFSGGSVFASRAARELVQIASQIRHPMLAVVSGCEEYSDGTLCIVAEYVPGRTLDAWVGDHGAPGVDLAVDFVRRLALGLQSAHQRGVSHNALYPGNIVVLEPDTKPGGRIAAKLLDLGVPRNLRPGLRFEAAHFMAPEALASELRDPGRPVAIDARANVYSCGCLLHYLCTGEPPFQSDSIEGLAALHARGERRAGSALPAALERVIDDALQLDPARRPESAAAFAAALSQTESHWRSSGVRPKLAPRQPDEELFAAAPEVTPSPTAVLELARPREVRAAAGTSARIASRIGLVPLVAATRAPRPRPPHFERAVRRLVVPPPAGVAVLPRAARPTSWASALVATVRRVLQPERRVVK